MLQLADQLSPNESIWNDELFLASHLIRQAGTYLQANEMLALLETLRPVFQRQPQQPPAMKTWFEFQASYLRNAGRTDDYGDLTRQMAETYPHDSNVQSQYAQALQNANEYEAAMQHVPTCAATRKALGLP